MTLDDLPGVDLVAVGIDDPRSGREPIAALLVAIGAPRTDGTTRSSAGS